MSCTGHDMNCNCDGECQWTDIVKARCAGRCGDVGDPPCYKLPSLTSDAPKGMMPCADCREVRVRLKTKDKTHV